MSKLEDLKAQAAAKLGSVHADVLTYISALESKATGSYWYLGGALVIGLAVGAYLGHKL